MMSSSQRCFPSSWLLMLGAGALVAVLPLLSDTKCYVKSWEDSEDRIADVSSRDYLLNRHLPQSSRGYQFGIQLGTPMVTFWLAGVLWTRREAFQGEEPLQRWASRFAKGAIVYGLVGLMFPWLFVVCVPSLTVFFGIVNGISGGLYVFCQVALCLTALHRLRLVKAEESAKLAQKMILAMTGFASLAVAVLVPWKAGVGGIFVEVVFYMLFFFAAVAYVSFQVIACRGLLKAAQLAKLEAEREGVPTHDADLAMNVAIAVAWSGSTTIGSQALMFGADVSHVISILYQVTFALDIASDVVLAMVAVNAIGGGADAGTSGSGSSSTHAYRSVGMLVEQRRARLIKEKLQASLMATSGPALAVAALLEDTSPEQLLERATQRFRSVHWETLADNSQLVTGGGLLQEVGAGKSELYNLSSPCKLSACDVFWSQSWSDSGVEKWQAIQSWAAEFKQQFERWPSLWFDKLCINQSSISDDLLCLPVFLAACNGLLVTTGRTYASRLWCALELFVYFAMATEDASRKPPKVLLLGDQASHQSVRLSWLAFDVQNCNCYHAGDKTRILQIIAAFPEGTFGFNSYIRDLAHTVLSTKEADLSRKSVLGSIVADQSLSIVADHWMSI